MQESTFFIQPGVVFMFEHLLSMNFGITDVVLGLGQCRIYYKLSDVNETYSLVLNSPKMFKMIGFELIFLNLFSLTYVFSWSPMAFFLPIMFFLNLSSSLSNSLSLTSFLNHLSLSPARSCSCLISSFSLSLSFLIFSLSPRLYIDRSVSRNTWPGFHYLDCENKNATKHLHRARIKTSWAARTTKIRSSASQYPLRCRDASPSLGGDNILRKLESPLRLRSREGIEVRAPACLAPPCWRLRPLRRRRCCDACEEREVKKRTGFVIVSGNMIMMMKKKILLLLIIEPR